MLYPFKNQRATNIQLQQQKHEFANLEIIETQNFLKSVQLFFSKRTRSEKQK
jgi:hypothetical protein